jgi:hypothetical protein
VQKSPLSALPAAFWRPLISSRGLASWRRQKQPVWRGWPRAKLRSGQMARSRGPIPTQVAKPRLAADDIPSSKPPAARLAVDHRRCRNCCARFLRSSSEPSSACSAPRLWPVAIPAKLTARARASAPFWAVPSQKQRRSPPANELSNLRLERIHLETEFSSDRSKAESATKLGGKRRGGMGAGGERVAHGTFSKTGQDDRIRAIGRRGPASTIWTPTNV